MRRASVPARRDAGRGAFGRRSEALACQLLTSQGYTIVQRNVRYPVGELDVIAWDGATLCFVEVRATSSMDWGGPLASIGPRKRQHLIRAAQWYLNRCHPVPEESRFDVVAIHWEAGGKPEVELIRGAFEADTGWH